MHVKIFLTHVLYSTDVKATPNHAYLPASYASVQLISTKQICSNCAIEGNEEKHLQEKTKEGKVKNKKKKKMKWKKKKKETLPHPTLCVSYMIRINPGSFLSRIVDGF